MRSLWFECFETLILLQETVEGACANATGLDIASALRENCLLLAYMWKGFNVDLEAFEAALVSAVDHAGHMLRHRKYPPVRHPTSPSGWSRQ